MAANEIPIASYQCKLLNRVEVAEGAMAFYFEKPSRFDFKPGQAARRHAANLGSEIQCVLNQPRHSFFKLLGITVSGHRLNVYSNFCQRRFGGDL